MLYQDIESYTPNFKMHKEGYLVLDLAALQRPIFKEIYKKIGEQSKIEQKIVENRFTDTLLSPDDLNLKLKAVILTYDCFQRQFKPVDQAKQYPGQCTPYQYLKKKYESYLTIGLKINLQKPQEIQQLKHHKILKKINLFSFDLTQSQMQKQLPLMRKYVKQLFSISQKIHFHIKVQLQTVDAFKKLKQELILNQYPIEYCVLQTNLINLIEKRFKLNFSQNWEEIAFKYTKVIAKYIPSAIGCLLENYQINKQEVNVDIGSILSCMNHINHRNQREQKQYKRFHNTGVGIIEPLIFKLLRDFTPDEYGHFRAKGDWNIYLSKLYDVLVGKYQSQKNHMLLEQGKYEQS